MPITTSQVALALDVIVHASESEPAAMAARVITAAFTTNDWTGKVEGQCNEYGKAPVSEDPEAQKAVLKLKAIANRLVNERGLATTNEPMLDLLTDLQNILDA